MGGHKLSRPVVSIVKACGSEGTAVSCLALQACSQPATCITSSVRARAHAPARPWPALTTAGLLVSATFAPRCSCRRAGRALMRSTEAHEQVERTRACVLLRAWCLLLLAQTACRERLHLLTSPLAPDRAMRKRKQHGVRRSNPGARPQALGSATMRPANPRGCRPIGTRPA